MSKKNQIPEISFSKSFRGYDTKEVENYVQQVSEFELNTQAEQTRLTDKVGELEKEVARFRDLESSLFKAMKMAEEAQEVWYKKVELEAKSFQENAQKEVDKILLDAQNHAEKIKFLAESERKSLLATANQQLKEEERALISLQEARKEIAQQLSQISNFTLERIDSWNFDSLDKPTSVAFLDNSLSYSISQQSQKPMGINQKTKLNPNPNKNLSILKNPKIQTYSSKLDADTLLSAEKSISKNAQKANDLVGESSRAKSKSKRPTGKSSGSTEKSNLSTSLTIGSGEKSKRSEGKQKSQKTKSIHALNPGVIEDDGLPTLNKVLEAYAKSSAPQGRIGDLN